MKKLMRLSYLVLALSLFAGRMQGAYYPFQIFTSNGMYSEGSEIDIYVLTSELDGKVNFTFYNDSNIESSVARIYFEIGSFLSQPEITNGPDTSFSNSTSPANVPGWNELDPSFNADTEISISADNPPSHNGIEQEQWLNVSYTLAEGFKFIDVINALDQGEMRIAMHIIGLPDGSSESAILVPEPATIVLLGLGTLALVRRKRSTL